MSFKQFVSSVFFAVILAAGITGVAIPARANVYATNIKLNGSTNGTASTGASVPISYILNEPALLGVTLKVLAGTNVIRTLVFPGDNFGTFRGLNEVVWDGKDAASNTVPLGTYSVNITAASSGYTNWQQTTIDGLDQTVVWAGRGIAVDRNPNSLYYWRIFIANADTGTDPLNILGDRLGVMKLNADGSAADEGGSSGGLDGHDWSGGETSPWKLWVSDDDYVYVDDLANHGEVYRWDPTFSTNSLQYVLRADNRPSSARLDGPVVVGSGTNAQIWMADMSGPNGVRKWAVTTNGTCISNNLGTTILALGGDLHLPPSAFALDRNGNIYVCQNVGSSGDTNSRVLRFPAGGGTTADWAVGTTNDEYGGAFALSVDPTGTYLAACFRGINQGGFIVNGNTKILSAATGALVTNVDLGVAMRYSDGNFYSDHDDTGCAWDAVGNMYYLDNFFGRWRALSPPGTNQATTVGLATLQIGLPSIVITSIQSTGGTVTITFTAAPSETPSSFVVKAASSPAGPYSTVAATITTVGPGEFKAVLQSGSQPQFYRIARASAAPTRPALTGITRSGGTAVISFTAGANDAPSAFTLWSGPSCGGAFSAATGATIEQLGPGSFRATVSAPNAAQFYRVGR
jgi:hypothetical protein